MEGEGEGSCNFHPPHLTAWYCMPDGSTVFTVKNGSIRNRQAGGEGRRRAALTLWPRLPLLVKAPQGSTAEGRRVRVWVNRALHTPPTPHSFQLNPEWRFQKAVEGEVGGRAPRPPSTSLWALLLWITVGAVLGIGEFCSLKLDKSKSSFVR